VNEILGALPQNQFLQVHKSFIVALAHIQTIESNHIQIGKHAIPIGKAFRENLFHVLKSHGRNVGR
jgi:DNA-binding LytR/AlgR family response regulator